MSKERIQYDKDRVRAAKDEIVEIVRAWEDEIVIRARNSKIVRDAINSRPLTATDKKSRPEGNPLQGLSAHGPLFGKKFERLIGTFADVRGVRGGRRKRTRKYRR